MTSRLRIPLIAGLILFVACDEDPVALTGCDAPHGCEVDGIDIAILEANIRFDDDQPFRTQVDAHVVAPGDTLEVRVRVVNRGTEAAPGALLKINDPAYDPIASAPIPALEAGEERTIRLEIVLPQLRMWPYMEYGFSAYLATDSTDWLYDAETGNNYRFGDDASGLAFHPLVPILEVEMTLPDTIRSLHPHIFSAVVHNRSPFVATGDLPFGVCIYPGNSVCLDQPDGPRPRRGWCPPAIAGWCRSA